MNLGKLNWFSKLSRNPPKIGPFWLTGEKAEKKYTLGTLRFNSLCRKCSTAVRIEKKNSMIKKKKSKTHLKINHNFFLLWIHLITFVSLFKNYSLKTGQFCLFVLSVDTKVPFTAKSGSPPIYPSAFSPPLPRIQGPSDGSSGGSRETSPHRAGPEAVGPLFLRRGQRPGRPEA